MHPIIFGCPALMSEEEEVEEEEPKILFTSEPSPQNKSCSECHGQQDVRNIFFGMSICQYVNMSECNFSAWVSK